MRPFHCNSGERRKKELQRVPELLQAVRVLTVREHRNKGGEQAEVQMKPDKWGAVQPCNEVPEWGWADSAEPLCARDRAF